IVCTHQRFCTNTRRVGSRDPTLFHHLITMSQMDTSEVFYIMAKQCDIAGTYTLLMDSASSHWFALNVDAAPDQHVFTHLSLSTGQTSSGKIQYTVWYLKTLHGSRVGVSLVEYHPSDQGFAHARV